MNSHHSERVIVLAPQGRDAEIACAILAEAKVESIACPGLPELVAALKAGAGSVIVSEEAIRMADLTGLSRWIGEQPEWSDFPFVLLTWHGGGVERNPAARRFLEILGNVTFLERPFHPTTLVSIIQASLRGRRRQYDARARLEKLRESQVRYASLFNSIDEGFAIIEFLDGEHGRFSDYLHVEANPAFENNTGIGNVVGMRLREVVSPNEADSWIAMYRDVLLTGEPIRVERDLLETSRTLELGAFRVEPASRKQVAVLFRDVTSRKHAEAQLKALNDNLEAQVLAKSAERDRLWNLSQDMLARADYTGMMSAVSPAWERVLGWNEQELLARGYAFFMHPDDRDSTLEAIGRMAEDGTPTSFENRIQTKAGDWTPVEWTVAPEPDGLNFIAVGRDLSAAKARGEELKLAQESLRQSQKLEAIGQLTGGVAHDFNNLLMAILSSLSLLRRRVPDDPAIHRLIENALQGAERGATLTQRMLAFARRQDLSPEQVDLKSLVKGMTGLLEQTLGPRWPVSLELEDGLPAVMADPNQIEMALLNLAVNARDAMADGGPVDIRILQRELQEPETPDGRQAGLYVGLQVSDSGHGMDKATLDRATEPFFTTKGLGKGTGLGLPMIHGLAQQLGGAFTLHSDVGRGTTATLWLPATSRSSDAAIAEPTAPEPAHDQGQLTILAVDDDALVLMNTVDLLEDLGHRVIDANSGLTALDLLRKHEDIDLLITDQAMPGMTGAQLVQQVTLERPDLPIILATGYGELPAGFRPSVVKLTKPFTQEVLKAALARATNEL